MHSLRENEQKLLCFCRKPLHNSAFSSLLLADGGYLGIALLLSCILSELPRGSPIAFWHFLAVLQKVGALR